MTSHDVNQIYQNVATLTKFKKVLALTVFGKYSKHCGIFLFYGTNFCSCSLPNFEQIMLTSVVNPLKNYAHK